MRSIILAGAMLAGLCPAFAGQSPELAAFSGEASLYRAAAIARSRILKAGPRLTPRWGDGPNIGALGRSNPVLESLSAFAAFPDSELPVRINRARILDVADRTDTGTLKPSDWRAEVFIDEDSERTIDFFMLGNAINFKFWRGGADAVFTTEYKGQPQFGAFAMWASLKRALESGIPILDASYLASLNEGQVRRIFAGSVPMPMIAERTAILRQVGRVLKAKYGGHFSNLARTGGYRAFNGGNGIVELLARDFPSFNDVESFRGTPIKFYKRAQLAVGMLYSRLKGTGLFDVADIGDLTVFADYELPKGLRSLGILEYGPQLAQAVDHGRPIPKGSEAEVALRAQTVLAAEYLRDALARKGKGTNALGVDYFLWWSARQDNAHPHHLTVTTAY